MEGNIRETNINLLAIEIESGKNRMVLNTDSVKNEFSKYGQWRSFLGNLTSGIMRNKS